MGQLADWLGTVAAGRQPVFVGFNAPFDWMFVADYLWRHLGRNPFGISALDLKSYFMGRERIARWSGTRKIHARERYGIALDESHHALADARDQALLARVLMGRDGGSSGL
jgi:DNA polymerase III epsilon subunit-like protein